MRAAGGAASGGGLPVYRAEAVRQADRRAMEMGTPGMTLMERAGAGAWRVIRRYLRGRPSARVVVLAGRGNNGGDGLVVARLAHAEGYPVATLLLGRPGDLRGDAAEACRRAREAGVEIVPLDPDGGTPAEILDLHLEQADLVVDALLGTGGRGAPRGGFAEAIQAVNRWRERRRERQHTGQPPGWGMVAALDLPSGLDPDTGRAAGAVIAADFTVTFGALKTGLLMGPALRFTGAVHLIDIGLPAEAFPEPDAFLVTPALVRSDLPPADPDAHKGSRGRVLVAAGSRGMSGAAILAARGALRGGAGLVFAAVPAGERPVVASAVPEALTIPLPEDEAGRPGPGAAEAILAWSPAPDAVVLGPGLGRSPAVTAAVLELMGRCPAPMVVDADGLNALAGSDGEPDAPAGAARGTQAAAPWPGPRVLTPHPGEAARLLGTTTGAVQQDRPAAARELARRWGAVAVLKGARTLVAEPSGRLWIIPTGSPALATGGTGDVLAGLIGALLAGGMAAPAAARTGAFLHGWAGQRLARRWGTHGALAGDVPAAVARARALLARGGAREAADRRMLESCGIILEDAGDLGD